MTLRALPAASACVLLCLALLPANGGAEDVEALRAELASARDEAGALAAKLQASRAELAAAEQEAVAASAREERLSALLVNGEERAARLAAKVRATQRRLAMEKRRLRRARAVLAARLVAIYESGAPSAAGVILGASDFDELATRSGYLERVEQSDADLAARVAQVRRAVARTLSRIAMLKAEVDAHNNRLEAARAEIAGVRQNAEAAAGRTRSLAARRSTELTELKSRIGEWVEDIEAAEAASRAQAEGTVERWLGGPYSIPTYIVMCESGGNYGALNPSSGAGGAYQILPSTWALYGGQGAPHEAPKAEQDRIAAEIWADSGGSAWVCA
jgi:septal ring factor EnvC (AmiA/AmiB activator)